MNKYLLTLAFLLVFGTSAKAAHLYIVELRAIAQRHNLKINDIAEITDRKQPETVEGWLNEKPLIPIKALRLLRRWAAKQPIKPGADDHENI